MASTRIAPRSPRVRQLVSASPAIVVDEVHVNKLSPKLRKRYLVPRVPRVPRSQRKKVVVMEPESPTILSSGVTLSTTTLTVDHEQ